ncbi:hypothetical protein ACFPK9_11400 [Rubritalea spongiae]|uniref:Lipoprotein n=1 Tax=Rubritalea spongiae TaxID=430797 RepID=A0ABW5E047_9BACT
MNVSLQLLAAPLILLSACASNAPELDVSVYQLKQTEIYDRDSPVARSEQQKRLRGAVSAEERAGRLGGYYTVEWSKGEMHDSTGPVEIVFLYRQAGTASKVHKKVRGFPASKRKGVTEFSVIGEEYQQDGRVLNWRSELYVGGELIAHDQSYLWQ